MSYAELSYRALLKGYIIFKNGHNSYDVFVQANNSKQNMTEKELIKLIKR